MHTRASISTFLVIAVAVWAVFLWLLGINLTWDYAKPYSLTLLALTSAWWLFDNHLWKNWPCRKFAKLPDLNGTWRVELHSTYTDPSTGQQSPPTEGYAAIRQSFSALSIRLMTEQSESFLVASSIERQSDGTNYVYGVYQSDPSIIFRGRVSEIHYGSFKYKVIGNPALEMAGHYWTDRNTNGSIKLEDRVATYFDSYASARRNHKPAS